MNKTLRDVALTLYDVPNSVSCKFCTKEKCNTDKQGGISKKSCVDCIEDKLEEMKNKDRVTSKKPRKTIIDKEFGSY